MSESSRYESGDGAQLPVSLVNADDAQVELDAERLLVALEAIVVSEVPATQDAEKYIARLNFAMGRVSEMRRQSQDEGGVFAPARAEVALSILEGHVAVAAGFINRTMRKARRAPGRRELHASVDEAVALVEDQNKAA
jgi:hypothetical protein